MKIEMLLMCITFQFKSGAPTQEISKRNSTDNASWGGGPNTENSEKKFYKQCKLGWGLNKEKLDSQFQQTMQYMYDKSTL